MIKLLLNMESNRDQCFTWYWPCVVDTESRFVENLFNLINPKCHHLLEGKSFLHLFVSPGIQQQPQHTAVQISSLHPSNTNFVILWWKKFIKFFAFFFFFLSINAPKKKKQTLYEKKKKTHNEICDPISTLLQLSSEINVHLCVNIRVIVLLVLFSRLNSLCQVRITFMQQFS